MNLLPGHDDEDQASKQDILDNLIRVETALNEVIREHRTGQFGYVTREWGFTTPGGLGGRLGGKFSPWEDKLSQVKDFFWPLEAYLSMEEWPFGQASEEWKDLDPVAEQLSGNTPLHAFLKEAPTPAVELLDEDFQEYKTAARLMILLGTLSHLYGNSSKDRSTAVLPSWIEDPLTRVAQRLQVTPTLSGHFLVQENWMWQSEAVANDPIPQQRPTLQRAANEDLRGRRNLFDGDLVQVILQQALLDDRRYLLKIYPNCFVGSQLVDVLMEQGRADNREDAVRLGRRLNERYHLFHHVTDDHLLMDMHLFCK